MSKQQMSLSAGRPSARSNKNFDMSSVEREKTKRVNFLISLDSHAKLKIFAARQNKTISQVMSEFVDQLPDE